MTKTNRITVLVVSLVSSLLILPTVLIAGSPSTAAVVSSTAPSASSAQGASTEEQQITGRITRLDMTKGVFSVREGDNGRVIDFVTTSKSVDIRRLRRGERVVVTYSGNVATKIEAIGRNGEPVTL